VSTCESLVEKRTWCHGRAPADKIKFAEAKAVQLSGDDARVKLEIDDGLVLIVHLTEADGEWKVTRWEND
jgi:hypothetical protein